MKKSFLNKIYLMLLLLMCCFLIACSSNKTIIPDNENSLDEIKPIEKSEINTDSTGEKEQQEHELKDEENRESDTDILSDIKNEIDIEKFLSEIDCIKENLMKSYPDKYCNYIRVYSYNGDVIIEPLDIIKDENGELKHTLRIGVNYKDYLYYNEMRWIVIMESSSPFILLHPELEGKSILDFVSENEAIEEDDPRYLYILEKKEKERDWFNKIVSEENVVYDDSEGLTAYP